VKALEAKLLAARFRRERPATDDKILADWNGLMIAALAFAGASFGRPDWIAMAERAFGFVTGTMQRDGRLAHSWRAGKAVYPGLASDYGAMAKAALALHQATLAPRWLAAAEGFVATARAHHWDAGVPGYFLSADDAEALIVRPRAATDEATPSGTSLLAQALARLWRLTGNDTWRADADAVLGAAGAQVATNLFSSTGLLNALDLRLNAIDVVVVVPMGTDSDAAVGEGGTLLAAVRRHTTPNVVLSVHSGTADLPADHPASGKTAIEGRPTAYVCRGATCSLPVTDEGQVARLIAGR
jgi:uncharacterized protein YyaL (SSP411 family)